MNVKQQHNNKDDRDSEIQKLVRRQKVEAKQTWLTGT